MRRDARHAGIGPVRTQAEVAAIMTKRGHPMGKANVYDAEKKGITKLARDPELRRLFDELEELLAEDRRACGDALRHSTAWIDEDLTDG